MPRGILGRERIAGSRCSLGLRLGLLGCIVIPETTAPFKRTPHCRLVLVNFFPCARAMMRVSSKVQKLHVLIVRFQIVQSLWHSTGGRHTTLCYGTYHNIIGNTCLLIGTGYTPSHVLFEPWPWGRLPTPWLCVSPACTNARHAGMHLHDRARDFI